MRTARTIVAAATPISVDRQPRTIPDAEHDRQRLDELDGTREESAQEDQDRARAHLDSITDSGRSPHRFHG